MPSGRTPSPRSPSRATTKSALRNRERDGACAANSLQRSSEAGSRSTAISSPSAPIRSESRRAWPPPPKVQSTKTSPGCGSRTSISSVASTGSCSWGTYVRFADRTRFPAAGCGAGELRGPTTLCVAVDISASFALGEVLGDVGDLCVHFGLVGGPAPGAPDLEPVVGTDDHAGALAQAGVLDQLLRQADAAGGVQGLVEGAPVKVAPQHAAALAERVGLPQERLREVLVAAGREHPDRGVEALGENDSISQGRAEPRWDREAVLSVEIVLVLTEKRQVGFLFRGEGLVFVFRSGPGGGGGGSLITPALLTNSALPR